MTKTTKTPRPDFPANALPTIEELPAKIADLESRPTFGDQGTLTSPVSQR